MERWSSGNFDDAGCHRGERVLIVSGCCSTTTARSIPTPCGRGARFRGQWPARR
jgi:hypothetical protein